MNSYIGSLAGVDSRLFPASGGILSDVPSEVLGRHAGETGYSPEMLRWGFAQMAARFEVSGLSGMFRAEAPGRVADMFDGLCRAHDGGVGLIDALMPASGGGPVVNLLYISASTVPSASWQDVMIFLMLPVRVYWRPASNLRPLFVGLLDEFCSVHPQVSGRVTIIDTGRDDSLLSEYISKCGIINVCGSDATIAHVRELCMAARPDAVIVGHGSRISAAVLDFDGASLGDGEFLDDVAGRLAVDASVWDRRGCLSPHVVLSSHDFEFNCGFAGGRLVPALSDFAGLVPSSGRSTGDRASLNVALRMAALDGARIFNAPGNDDYVVVYPEGVQVRPIFCDRVVSVFSVSDPYEAACGLPVLGQGMSSPLGALAGEVHPGLCGAGFNYFCGFGGMQTPGPDWVHGGLGTVAPFFGSCGRGVLDAGDVAGWWGV